MADSNLVNLTAITAPAETDLLYVVANPSSTPLNRKITLANLFANTAATLVAGSSTTVNLYNTTVTTLNIGGAATAISLGAAVGTLTLNNPNILMSNATSVGIGTGSPNANALLDISSTTKAFMPPRMTTTQKNAITSPVAGMVVFDTSVNELSVYESKWETLSTTYYGVTWDESADTYARTGRLSGIAVGATANTSAMPIHTKMRRCVVNDSGRVVYYLNPFDSTKKENGDASVLTGVDGQVMVEIPAFWIRYSYVGTTHRWDISDLPIPGFTLHPAFTKNGAAVDARYIGAYEAVLYDVSASIYANGIYQTAFSCTFALADSSITAGSRTAPFKSLSVGDKITISGTTLNNGTFTVASIVSDTKITTTEALVDETAANTVIETQKDWTATTGDKLASVSGKKPINYGTRANFRAAAKNRGTGWRQMDFYLLSAIQLLYLVEYGSFYSQSMIGAGITNVGDWATYNDYNPINVTGQSNSIGNVTTNTAGGSTGAAEVGKYLSYRGIENWFGHIWKWEDGFNINSNVSYVSNTDTQFADDTATNYTALGVTLANADGYQATLAQIGSGFLPLTVGASSTTKITDYYWQNSGWRVALFGAAADDGASAGAFAYYLNDNSGDLYRYISGRLCF